MVDVGAPIHYSAVKPGTPVYSSDGQEVGRVEVILDNYREHIFDGVVFVDEGGTMRFADAPEVERTAEQGILLRLETEDARCLGPPDEGHPKFKPSQRGGRLSRLFGGGGWKRH
ncbi:MAG: hypothetical protein WD827_00225 [Solirubrobacterales bacterium]